jgi:hypothetical protein
VFESRVLRRIFQIKGKKMAGGWSRLNKEELHNVNTLPSIIKVIKSKRM